MRLTLWNPWWKKQTHFFIHIWWSNNYLKWRDAATWWTEINCHQTWVGSKWTPGDRLRVKLNVTKFVDVFCILFSLHFIEYTVCGLYCYKSRLYTLYKCIFCDVFPLCSRLLPRFRLWKSKTRTRTRFHLIQTRNPGLKKFSGFVITNVYF